MDIYYKDLMKRNILMQVNTNYNDLINKVKAMGVADAKSGINPEPITDIMYGYSTAFIEEEFSEKIRNDKENKINLSNYHSRLDVIIKEIKRNKNTFLNIKDSSVYKAVLFYLIPAAIYLLCDVLFSKELIVQGWGLGLSSAFETWSLAIGIGLAPFIVKFIIDRFVEPAYLSSSQSVKRFITGFYITLGIGVIMAFLQVAYLRGVIFKYTKISIIGNAYDSLYLNYPNIMTASFVTVAFMFVVGGGILMSIGSKQISNWSQKRKLQKQIDKLEKKQKGFEEKICEYSGLSMQSDFMNYDEKNLKKNIERLHKDLIYQYKSALKTTLSEVKENKNIFEKQEKIPLDNFHEYTREILDKASRNGIIQL